MGQSQTSYTDSDFLTALSFNLQQEGKYYEDVAGDPGGPTKWGVTWIDGNQWRRANGLAPLTISQARATRLGYLTEPIIDQIYFTHYWLPMKGGDLPDPLDGVLFDAAINCGGARSVQWLQGVVGTPPDGVFGPNTLRATNSYLALHGQAPLINGLLARRADYYVTRGSWANKFKRGWANRVADLTKAVRSSLSKQSKAGS